MSPYRASAAFFAEFFVTFRLVHRWHAPCSTSIRRVESGCRLRPESIIFQSVLPFFGTAEPKVGEQEWRASGIRPLVIFF